MANVKDVKDVLKKVHDNSTGLAAWREIRGQEFSHEEARQAADFADCLESYGITEEYEVVNSELLVDFLDEAELKVGQRLFLAEKAPLYLMGVIMLKEDDNRLMRVAKARAKEDSRESSVILLPGD